MSSANLHPSDQDLLRAVDGELERAQDFRIRQHLASCWSCRARAHKLEQTITDFTLLHHEGGNSQLPSPDAPRALLKAQLSALAAKAPRPSLLRRAGIIRAAVACAVLIVAGLLFWQFRLHTEDAGREVMVQSASNSVPNAKFTPGVAVLAVQHDICKPSRATESPTPVISRATAAAVFARYGIADPSPGEYEIDYLVSPELGGSDDVRNLWPQPYSGTWNAHLKDALEEHLHWLVCSGAVDLSSAQRDMASDWVEAYKKYFRTTEPLSLHASFLKDAPWEETLEPERGLRPQLPSTR